MSATRPGEPTETLAGTEPPAPVTVPQTPFVVLILLLVIGGVVGILLFNTKLNENAFVLHELRQQEAELHQRQQQLEEEIARASSTAELVAAASRMGLVDLRDQLVHLHLSEESTVVEAGG